MCSPSIRLVICRAAASAAELTTITSAVTANQRACAQELQGLSTIGWQAFRHLPYLDVTAITELTVTWRKNQYSNVRFQQDGSTIYS